MATSNSAGRSGAIPRTAISLAVVAPATKLATAGNRLAAGSGWSCRDPPSLDMVSFEQDAQASQGQKLVTLFNGRRFLRHQGGQSARGDNLGRVVHFRTDPIDQGVDHPRVAEDQAGLNARHRV